MNPILFTKTRTGYTIASGRAMVKIDERKAFREADVTLFTHEPEGWKQWETSTHVIEAAYGKAKRLLLNNK